jgi:hypothetical protein
MHGKKSFKGLFWALVILTMLVTVYYIYSIYILLSNDRVPGSFIQTLIWQFSITVLLLCVECFNYWKFHKQILVRWWGPGLTLCWFILVSQDPRYYLQLEYI